MIGKMTHITKPDSLPDTASVLDDAFLLESATISDTTQLTGHARMFGHAKAVGASRIAGKVFEHACIDNADVEPEGTVHGWAIVARQALVRGTVRDRAQVFEACIPKGVTIGGFAQINGALDVPHGATIVGDGYVTEEAHVMVEQVSPTRTVSFYRSSRYGIECADVTDGTINYTGPLAGYGGETPGPLERALSTKARNAIASGTP